MKTWKETYYGYVKSHFKLIQLKIPVETYGELKRLAGTKPVGKFISNLIKEEVIKNVK